jgi:selenocysteine-specific elongation factor
MPLTVGTAGHIDHGKTWLVRALTGKDTDRLPEEQARGISIDLGYAPLELPDGRQLSLVDVPGHERFVRTMIAGATGIDLFLLVIDAQEGARPQTLEHLAILQLLGVEHGVVAVTKADAVDLETLELALDEARELVPGAEVVAVSAKTGAGLDELRQALARVPVETRDAAAATRLYVDRVFTLQGVGTIATGTLWSGTIAAGDLLRVEPRGETVRVRSVQVHDTAVERAEAGQRVAVNLPALERRDLARGDVLVEPGYYPVSYRLDIRLEAVAEIPAAVTVHIGTKAVPARVVRDGEYAQLRLQEPVVAARGDRVVLRTGATVGGGVVLDPAPVRRLERARLAALDHGTPEEIVGALVYEPVRRAELQARGLLSPAELTQGLSSAHSAGDYFFSDAWLDGLRKSLHERLAARAAAERTVDAVGAGPARDRAPRCEGLPARHHGGAWRTRRRSRCARGAARAGGDREGRRPGARGVPRRRGPHPARRRRLRGVNGAVRPWPRVAAGARDDHARGVSRRARRRPPHGAALARALRRGRAHVAARRRAHVAASALAKEIADTEPFLSRRDGERLGIRTASLAA